MKIKNKLQFPIAIALMSFAIFSMIFQGCEKEEAFTKISTENRLIELANKYNVKISFNENDSEISKLQSFNEVEQIFKALAYVRKNEITKKIELVSIEEDNFIVKTIEAVKPRINRLKSSSVEQELALLHKWFYDLTTFNVSLKYDFTSSTISNIIVNSYYTGVSLYDYTQISAAANSIYPLITFTTIGKESHTWSIFGVEFTESRTVVSSGNYHIQLHEGEVTFLAH
jgi:hypothetical protein